MSDEKWISKHVTLVGVLQIVYHALTFVAGLVVLGVSSAIAAAVGQASGDVCSAAVLTTIGSVVAVFFIVLAIPGIVAGIGLLQGKSWARVLALIVGAIGLLDVPVGTALGIYTFWVLMRDEAVDFLARPSTAPSA
jgi:hypothetical protein